jgi:hypothetical protein
VQIVNGRAVVLDYGIENGDGSWRLASGNPVLDVDGNVIAAPTVADIIAQAHPAGEEWRVESFGYNAIPNIPVQEIGIDFVNGRVVDFTVQVTDQDGTFYVWARNLDRALAVQAKDGNARAFNLRNFAVDFSRIQEVNATDDSTTRVELLTPGQFNFATELDSIGFEPEMLTASIDQTTGIISYSVNQFGQSSLSDTSYVSAIDQAIGLLDPIMKEYITASRAIAVRLALQGGLKDFAQGISYDPTTDLYSPTTDRQIAPMLEAIFRAAPSDNTDNAILNYLTSWNEILWEIYPSYNMSSAGNMLGASENLDQTFILQMAIEAFENTGINWDIRGVAHALGVDETKIITDDGAGAEVDGTAGVDLLYMASGDHTYAGGKGSDYYFVGKNAGNDEIVDYGRGEINELIFTDALPTDVRATREGEDLIVSVVGTDTVIRIKDEFLGELNDFYTDGVQGTSGVDQLVFADGSIWDRMTLAYQVANDPTPNQVDIGSGSADVLYAAPGDYLSGGAAGDIYVYQRGDGLNVIDDQGNFSFGPIKAGLDFLLFRGGITENDLQLTRLSYQGSDSLKITLLDDQGVATDDVIVIKGQFEAAVFNLGAFSGLVGSSDGLNYVAPNEIERFVFDDGTSMDFTQIAAKVIEGEQTAGDDNIVGFATDDTLDGGAGDDFLSGSSGSDTYVFGHGYGHDVVEDNDTSSKIFGDPYTDVLQFKDGLTWADFDYIRTGDLDVVNLNMRISGTDDEDRPARTDPSQQHRAGPVRRRNGLGSIAASATFHRCRGTDARQRDPRL